LVLIQGTRAGISQINMAPGNNYGTVLVPYLFVFFLNDSSYLIPKNINMAIMALIPFLKRVMGQRKLINYLRTGGGTFPKKKKGVGGRLVTYLYICIYLLYIY